MTVEKLWCKWEDKVVIICILCLLWNPIINAYYLLDPILFKCWFCSLNSFLDDCGLTDPELRNHFYIITHQSMRLIKCVLVCSVELYFLLFILLVVVIFFPVLVLECTQPGIFLSQIFVGHCQPFQLLHFSYCTYLKISVDCPQGWFWTWWEYASRFVQ